MKSNNRYYKEITFNNQCSKPPTCYPPNIQPSPPIEKVYKCTCHKCSPKCSPAKCKNVPCKPVNNCRPCCRRPRLGLSGLLLLALLI